MPCSAITLLCPGGDADLHLHMHPSAWQVRLGEHNIVPNYFEQNQAEALDLNKTVLDTLVEAAPDAKINELKQLLGRMLFSGTAMEKKVREGQQHPAVQRDSSTHRPEFQKGFAPDLNHTCSHPDTSEGCVSALLCKQTRWQCVQTASLLQWWPVAGSSSCDCIPQLTDFSRCCCCCWFCCCC